MIQASPNSELRSQQFIEALYEKYRLYIIRIAHKYLLEYDAAEDILQETFIQIIRKADFLKSLPTPKLEAYITLMVRGLCIDFLRRNHQQDRVNMTDEAIVSMLNLDAATIDKSTSGYKKRELFMMLNKLLPEDQFLLIGRYYLELSVEELVTHIGGTATGIRTKLFRAKKRAYARWKEQDLTMEDFLNG